MKMMMMMMMMTDGAPCSERVKKCIQQHLMTCEILPGCILLEKRRSECKRNHSRHYERVRLYFNAPVRTGAALLPSTRIHLHGQVIWSEFTLLLLLLLLLGIEAAEVINLRFLLLRYVNITRLL
jgi:hypothetical protein